MVGSDHGPHVLELKKTCTLEGMRSIGGHILERGMTIARSQAPDLAVHSRLVNGSVVAALLNEAVQADLIVLGAYGSGGFADLDVGSAALQVPAYASCPVVVVRQHTPALRRVVVGVDCARRPTERVC